MKPGTRDAIHVFRTSKRYFTYNKTTLILIGYPERSVGDSPALQHGIIDVIYTCSTASFHKEIVQP